MDLSGLVAADVEVLFARRDFFSINQLWGLSPQQNFSTRTLHIFAYSSLVTIQKSKLIDILRAIVKANTFERLTALMCSKILPSPWGSLYLSLSTGTSNTTIGADLEQLFQQLFSTGMFHVQCKRFLTRILRKKTNTHTRCIPLRVRA